MNKYLHYTIVISISFISLYFAFSGEDIDLIVSEFKKVKLFEVFLASLILLISCLTTNPVSYSFDTNIGILMHPKFKIYHNQDSSSKVFFQLSTDEVLYTRNNRNQPFKAALTIKYSVFQNNSKTLIEIDPANSSKYQSITQEDSEGGI